jgi:hypothetical protein
MTPDRYKRHRAFITTALLITGFAHLIWSFIARDPLSGIHHELQAIWCLVLLLVIR